MASPTLAISSLFRSIAANAVSFGLCSACAAGLQAMASNETAKESDKTRFMTANPPGDCQFDTDRTLMLSPGKGWIHYKE
jgi:hypothetical protein